MKNVKLLALSLLLIGLLSCSSEEKSVSNEKATFWNDKLAQNAEYSKKLSDAWVGATAFQLDINSYQDTASYQTAVSQSIDSSDVAPNLFTWWSGEQLSGLASAGKLLALDDVWEDIIAMGVSPDVMSALSYEGVPYAVPYSLLNNVIIYNINAFEKAGIEKIPETFDEFLVVCQKLVDVGITPIGMKNDSWASFIWFQALLASFDPSLYLGVCDGSIPYTDEDVRKVFASWQTMLDKGYFSDPVAHLDNVKRIALEECAMFIEPQYEVNRLEDSYGQVPGEDIGVFALPSMNGSKKVVFFEVSPMMIPASVGNVEVSKKLVKEYFSTAVQTVTSREQGIVLTNTVEIESPTLTAIAEMVGDTDNYQSILRYYENTPSVLRDYALDELSKFIAGVQDADTTLGKVQAEAEKIF